MMLEALAAAGDSETVGTADARWIDVRKTRCLLSYRLGADGGVAPAPAAETLPSGCGLEIAPLT